MCRRASGTSTRLSFVGSHHPRGKHLPRTPHPFYSPRLTPRTLFTRRLYTLMRHDPRRAPHPTRMTSFIRRSRTTAPGIPKSRLAIRTTLSTLRLYMRGRRSTSVLVRPTPMWVIRSMMQSLWETREILRHRLCRLTDTHCHTYIHTSPFGEYTTFPIDTHVVRTTTVHVEPLGEKSPKRGFRAEPKPSHRVCILKGDDSRTRTKR
jgi:hypothetical protein